MNSQTYSQHFSALRRALIWSLVALILGVGVVGCALPWISKGLLYPLKQAIALLGETGTEGLQGLVSTRPMGVFSVLIQLCFFGGLGLSAPVILSALGSFIYPALEARERRFLLPGLGVALLLFLLGSALSFFIILPASLAISIQLNQMLGFELIWSASDYYGLVVWVTLALGFAFEFPLLLFLAAYWGWVPLQKLRELRRVFFVVFLIIAALINPSGDPIALFLIGGTMHILYELALLAAAKARASGGKGRIP